MLIIENEILESAKITEQDSLDDIAIMLYKKGKLSFGQAAKKSYPEFQFLLGKNHVPINYCLDGLIKDYTAIEQNNW